MLGALQSAFREPAFLRQGGDALSLVISISILCIGLGQLKDEATPYFTLVATSKASFIFNWVVQEYPPPPIRCKLARICLFEVSPYERGNSLSEDLILMMHISRLNIKVWRMQRCNDHYLFLHTCSTLSEHRLKGAKLTRLFYS
jgi:hypothetical protein